MLSLYSLLYARSHNSLSLYKSTNLNSIWPDCFVPKIFRLVPLGGGSSNHFSVKALKEAFFWDAYNVTEDADFGLRLAQMGYKTKIIDSETFEESPITILSWIKQRFLVNGQKCVVPNRIQYL